MADNKEITVNNRVMAIYYGEAPGREKTAEMQFGDLSGQYSPGDTLTINATARGITANVSNVMVVTWSDVQNFGDEESQKFGALSTAELLETMEYINQQPIDDASKITIIELNNIELIERKSRGK